MYMNLYQQQTQQTYNYIVVVVTYHRFYFFYIHNKMIGDGIMNKDIRFAAQIALLEQLHKEKLITEQEYKAILKMIKNDYNIPQI